MSHLANPQVRITSTCCQYSQCDLSCPKWPQKKHKESIWQSSNHHYITIITTVINTSSSSHHHIIIFHYHHHVPCEIAMTSISFHRSRPSVPGQFFRWYSSIQPPETTQDYSSSSSSATSKSMFPVVALFYFSLRYQETTFVSIL